MARGTLTLHLTLHPILGESRYDGLEGCSDPTAPVLAVGLDNGRVQLMRGEHDENVVLLDTSLRATKLKWNTAGTVLAVAGSQVRVLTDCGVLERGSNQAPTTVRDNGCSLLGVSWRSASHLRPPLEAASAQEDHFYVEFGRCPSQAASTGTPEGLPSPYLSLARARCAPPLLPPPLSAAPSYSLSPHPIPAALSQMTADMREANMVQFYSNNGVHLRTLRVPGTGINALSWEGGGLRIALAVDSYIYFANIRPDYKWGYFAGTLVYAFNKLDRAEQCVMFWDTATNERFPKYVKSLLAIRAHGEYCVLATKGEEEDQYILILCNAIGTPVDSKYIEVEPLYITMTQSHVVVCSEELVYVWQYSTHVRSFPPRVGTIYSKPRFGDGMIESIACILLPGRGKKGTAGS